MDINFPLLSPAMIAGSRGKPLPGRPREALYEWDLLPTNEGVSQPARKRVLHDGLTMIQCHPHAAGIESPWYDECSEAFRIIDKVNTVVAAALPKQAVLALEIVFFIVVIATEVDL
jgi:hypothetical protein